MSARAWRAIGASVPGARHLEASEPCEDAYAHALVAGADGSPAALVLAVADGAGSAPRAAEGAAIAVGAAVAAATSLLAQGIPSDASAWGAFADVLLTTAIRRHVAAADVLAAPDRADRLASTLTCAVVAAPWLCIASVGDGFAVVRREDGTLHLVLPQPDDPWASQTTFLTSPRAREEARRVSLWDPELAGVALATDGLVAAALRVGVPPRPEPSFLGPLIEHAAETQDAGELHRFLLANAELAETTRDDRTILMGVPA